MKAGILASVLVVTYLITPVISFVPRFLHGTSGAPTRARSTSFSTASPFKFVEDLFTSFQPNLPQSPPLEPPEKAQLLALIEDLESKGGSRGSAASPLAQGLELQRLLDALALANPNPQCAIKPSERARLVGVWRLVYTARANLGKEGSEWAQYLLANGPRLVGLVRRKLLLRVREACEHVIKYLKTLTSNLCMRNFAALCNGL